MARRSGNGATALLGKISPRSQGTVSRITRSRRAPGATSISEVQFNLRYPGQYADKESRLFYNYFRSYDARIGSYLQNDPIGLAGGPNRRIYVAAIALKFTDPFGLFLGPWHTYFISTAMQQMGYSERVVWRAAGFSTGADWTDGSQSPDNSHGHAMCARGWSTDECKKRYEDFIDQQLASCTMQGLGRALHAAQDAAARRHKNWQIWGGGIPSREHINGDANPTDAEQADAIARSKEIIRCLQASCPCTTLPPTSN
ncbi:RHS repeat-associated core domain-containing protein [Variovorax sp. YR750]|nr:RHS repeat-associated core domain-containing protein [Variovorax sp. YR750]SEL82216.1 RHS repeat-associated core domain-containing protein [Variovorax sp. YR750]